MTRFYGSIVTKEIEQIIAQYILKYSVEYEVHVNISLNPSLKINYNVDLLLFATIGKVNTNSHNIQTYFFKRILYNNK